MAIHMTLLQAAPPQTLDHINDTRFMAVVILHIPCISSLYHLKFTLVLLCVGVPHRGSILCLRSYEGLVSIFFNMFLGDLKIMGKETNR